MKTDRVLVDVFAGGLAGLTIAAGGAIKDAPYEGFDLFKFFRSIVIGMIEGPIVASYTNIKPELLFFVVIGTERVTVESWKVLRSARPAKFSIGEWGEKKCCACSLGLK